MNIIDGEVIFHPHYIVFWFKTDVWLLMRDPLSSL